MNWKTLSYLTVVAVVSGVLFSCYKSKNFSPNETAQVDSAIVTQSYDQVRVDAIIDEVFNDVNTALLNQSVVTGAGVPRSLRSGVTVTGGTIDTLTNTGLCNVAVYMDTTDIPNSISLNYIGPSCDNSRNLNGNVTIYFNPGTRWSSQFDTIGVNINKLTIQGVADTNTIRLNGTFYVANISGGSLSTLNAGSTPVVHAIVSPYLGVLYNAADTATWQVSRIRTYTNNGTGIVISTTAGTDTVGGTLNVAEWGGNRYGNSFILVIDSALTATAGCGYQIGSGQIQVSNPAGVTILNFGLNESGSPTGCPVSGSFYYFKFNWSGSGASPYSSIRPYPLLSGVSYPIPEP
jgi:hypothetical protein